MVQKVGGSKVVTFFRQTLFSTEAITDAQNFYFCTNFSQVENAIGSIQWPIPQNPPIDAKILQISYTSRVIANFVPNLVAMATT